MLLRSSTAGHSVLSVLLNSCGLIIGQVVNSNPNSPAISGAAIAGIVSGALVAAFVAARATFTHQAIAPCTCLAITP